jgi:Protein of unknown function (DUF3014)
MPVRDADFRPGNSSSVWPAALVVVVLLGAALGWWYWSTQKEAAVAPPVVSAAPAQAPVPDLPPPAAAAPAGPQNPVDALAAPDDKLPGLNDADARVTTDLDQLLGKKAVGSFVQTDGFVRRAVATVDNLTREEAPARMWPVQRAPGKFMVQGEGEVKTINPDNGARYTPFVQFAESVNTAHAVALYARLYPLFQSAYEELGYSGRYFNDRLVAVIDHLLSTPEPGGPLQVRLTQVKGEYASEHPLDSYEYVDPQLEALSAGQKMLVRTGPVNEHRLKRKLAEFRQQLATGPVAKK